MSTLRVKLFFLLLFAGFTSLLCASAAPLRVVVVDQTGAGFPDVLVIVRQLEGGAEAFRALSDKDGTVPARDILPGPYQLIATCPYGLCQTTVREFMMKGKSFVLKLSVAVMPTRGNTFTTGHIEHRDVGVLDQSGKPIPSVPLLVRDATAQNERWYKTGNNGTATVDVPPGAEMTIVAVHQENLTSVNVKTHDGNDKIVLHLGDRNIVPKGGALNSAHLTHQAADSHVAGMSDSQVDNQFKQSGSPVADGFRVI